MKQPVSILPIEENAQLEDPQLHIEYISPVRAQQMLDLNKGNRPINADHIAFLTREMALGRWRFNGDRIVISDGRLIDGQHRLHAVIRSGTTIKVVVIRGLSQDSFTTIDTGKKRSGADVLAMDGEVNTKSLAATLIVIHNYYTGHMDQTARYSNAEVQGFLAKYPRARDSVKATHETKRLIPRAILAALHYLFSTKNEDAANEFVHRLISGAAIHELTPIHVLRERLIQNTLSKAKLPRHHLMAFGIKAWNACRCGQQIRVLVYRKGEGFPTVH